MFAVLLNKDTFTNGVHDVAVGRAIKQAQIPLTHTDRVVIDNALYHDGAVSSHPVTSKGMKLYAYL